MDILHPRQVQNRFRDSALAVDAKSATLVVKGLERATAPVKMLSVVNMLFAQGQLVYFSANWDRLSTSLVVPVHFSLDKEHYIPTDAF